ncbi:MAG: sirohydrochlorin cobaltochelatase [Eggerthellaceae bacterium]|nr:sirohydrochlorin cobaltochelatase [Eggerthellaceae bacterium]
MKKKYLLACACVAMVAALACCLAGCATDESKAKDVGKLIDKIYVQERTKTTDADCKAAKDAWDKLTDKQKEMVKGENADPDYFGRDTGDASADDPLNQDGIGEKEILVVSFGTSFNDSRVATIGGIEKAIAAAYPDWSVRRAFTAQIIINHIQARDGEVIDNVEQAMDRAVANGVKQLIVQPTHLMHGAEYDELVEAINKYADKMTITFAEPLLGEVGADATVINADKKAVAEAVVADAAVPEDTALVLMGHGTSHTANITYTQMQTQMDELGYKNVFIGTVEGEPEGTDAESIIAKVKEAGYEKVVLRPLMVVAGDHANNDMADPDDDESWYSQFTAEGNFAADNVTCQIAGLGQIPAVQQIYVAHTAAAIG